MQLPEALDRSKIQELLVTKYTFLSDIKTVGLTRYAKYSRILSLFLERDRMLSSIFKPKPSIEEIFLVSVLTAGYIAEGNNLMKSDALRSLEEQFAEIVINRYPELGACFEKKNYMLYLGVYYKTHLAYSFDYTDLQFTDYEHKATFKNGISLYQIPNTSHSVMTLGSDQYIFDTRFESLANLCLAEVIRSGNLEVCEFVKTHGLLDYITVWLDSFWRMNADERSIAFDQLFYSYCAHNGHGIVQNEFWSSRDSDLLYLMLKLNQIACVPGEHLNRCVQTLKSLDLPLNNICTMVGPDISCASVSIPDLG